MSSEIAQGLKDWAGDDADERAEFARELARALEDNSKTGVWSLIDVRREFESRSGRHSGDSWGLRATRVILMAGYLGPIFFTWWELHSAVNAFARYAETSPGEPDLNLLSFWAGARNAYQGTHLQTTGLRIALFVLALIIGQVYVNIKEEFGSEHSDLPNELILRAQLQFASARAMTPQEVTEVVSAAATQLETALSKVAKTVETAATLVETIANASSTLDQSSEKMSRVAEKLGEILQPITDLSKTLADTNESLKATERSIAGTKDQIDDAGKSLMVIAQAGTDLTYAMEQIRTQASSLLKEIQSTTTAIRDAGTTIGKANESSSSVADQLSQLGVYLRAHEPHLLTMQKIVSDLKQTSEGIESSVHEVKQAVKDFTAINSGIQDALDQMNNQG